MLFADTIDGLAGLAEKGVMGIMLTATCAFIYFLTRLNREQLKEEREIFATALDKQKVDDRAERTEDRKIFREALATTGEKFEKAIQAAAASSEAIHERLDKIETILPAFCRAQHEQQRKP